MTILAILASPIGLALILGAVERPFLRYMQRAYRKATK